MSLHPPHEKEQVSAITYGLATAPDIQEDLKAKFGHGENIFFYLDLVEYRLKNSRLDIAEDLDVKSRYDVTTDNVAKISVSNAFRGYTGKDFPKHKFGGLLGKVTNDYIAGIRKSEGGLEARKRGDGIHGRTPEEMSEHGRIGGRASRGRGKFQKRELLEDIVKFREESIGKGWYSDKPSWNYIIAELNEKHNKNWTTGQIKKAYENNKDKLPDEEE